MRNIIAKHSAARALGIALSLAAFAVGGSQQDGINLLVQQIRSIGPVQWLDLMADSIIGAKVVAPLTDRIARSLPGRAVRAAENNSAAASAA